MVMLYPLDEVIIAGGRDIMAPSKSIDLRKELNIILKAILELTE